MSRVGRGGAGNYVPKEAQITEKTRTVEDIEAQRDAASADVSGAALTRVAPKEPDPYIRIGRGGAGNWSVAEDAEVANALEASASQSAAEAKAARPPVSAMGAKSADGGGATPITRGRGGAGNYAEVNNESEKQRRQQDDSNRGKMEQARRKIQEEVDGVIRPPVKAFINDRKE